MIHNDYNFTSLIFISHNILNESDDDDEEDDDNYDDDGDEDEASF